ncbi:MAG: transglutaminase N-terminal domain-containing protein [Methyloglobulus sp.]
MRRLQIKHVTAYQYDEPVTLLPHKILLWPREGHDIRIESAELIIYPPTNFNASATCTTMP